MNNPDARLEQLLRQWGARRAVDEASVPGVPAATAAAVPAVPPATITAEPSGQVPSPQAESVEHVEHAVQPPEPVQQADQTPGPDSAEVEMGPLVLELAESELHILDPNVREPPPDEPKEPVRPAEPQPAAAAIEDSTAGDAVLFPPAGVQADAEITAAAPPDADKGEESWRPTSTPESSAQPQSAEPEPAPVEMKIPADIADPAAGEVPADEADSTPLAPTLAGEDLDRAVQASAPAAVVEPVSTAPLEHVTADLSAAPMPQGEPISLEIAGQPEQAGQEQEEPLVELLEEQAEPDRATAADISDIADASDIADPDATVRLELSTGEGEPVTWPTIGLTPAQPEPESQAKPAAAPARQKMAAAPAGGKKKSAAGLMLKIAGLAILSVVLLFVGAVFLSDYADRTGLAGDIRRILSIPDTGRKHDAAADPDAAKAGQEIRKLRDDLDSARDQLRKSQDALRESQDSLHKTQEAFIAARLEKELQASDVQTRLTAASQQADTTRDSLQTALKDSQNQLNALKLQMQALEKKLQDANKEKAGLAEEVKQISRLQKDKKETDSRLASATDDLRKKSAQIDELEAARKKTQDELGGLQGEFLRTTRALHKLYMSASAPGQSGMAAAQAASKHNKLLSRCHELTNTPQEAPTRLLRDRVDAVLTKLELVPGGDWTAGQKFTKMVDDTGIIPLIDETLRGQREAPEINAWLMEVRIILVSAGCAG
ncbi:MAG: hypothetical protein HZA50_10220 [Planctomycetes bacterium]|nr:hypothetical protein [Planctomycetota bacterium]